MDVIGDRKTLIIANSTCGLQNFQRLNDRIYLYWLPGFILQQHDPIEKEVIKRYFEQEGCTQVIFLASIEQVVIERILRSDSQLSLTGLKFNTDVLLRHKSHTILSLPVRNQILTELLVSGQCARLMEYYFIQPGVASGKLVVRGIITETPAAQFKTIYYNGIMYNDLISMN